MDAQTLISVYRIGFYASMAVALLGLIVAVVLFVRFDIRTIWLIRTGRARKRSVAAMQEASRSGGRMRKDTVKRTAGEGAPTSGRINTTRDLQVDPITIEIEPPVQSPKGGTTVLSPADAPVPPPPKGGTTVLSPADAPAPQPPKGGTTVLTPQDAPVPQPPKGGTTVLTPQDAPVPQPTRGATTVLTPADAPTAQPPVTSVLGQPYGGAQTTVLSASYDDRIGGTEELHPAGGVVYMPAAPTGFVITEEVFLIHSTETI